jgi:phosphatidylinositol alpha-1,6-mannosyltransferase
VGISRLVPRKGFDVLIRASARLGVRLAVVGAGRDRRRLERLATATGARVQFLGRIPFDDLPLAYACGDVFAMLCRTRWGGLEQEGFGIVFLEAAAAGVPVLAGASGGVADAVVDGETGCIVARPDDVDAVTAALGRLLDDPDARARLGSAGRARAVESFAYDVLADRLGAALRERS